MEETNNFLNEKNNDLMKIKCNNNFNLDKLDVFTNDFKFIVENKEVDITHNRFLHHLKIFLSKIINTEIKLYIGNIALLKLLWLQRDNTCPFKSVDIYTDTNLIIQISNIFCINDIPITIKIISKDEYDINIDMEYLIEDKVIDTIGYYIRDTIEYCYGEFYEIRDGHKYYNDNIVKDFANILKYKVYICTKPNIYVDYLLTQDDTTINSVLKDITQTNKINQVTKHNADLSNVLGDVIIKYEKLMVTHNELEKKNLDLINKLKLQLCDYNELQIKLNKSHKTISELHIAILLLFNAIIITIIIMS